ncbi:hypothetical protein SEPCBS119000_001526 [Sporothrix epigloea]|uniref:Mannosyl transferase n=1 Tax=Sporothrix epigloea TaxID=1892477 RepID=A0ABP0DCV7_9PEZI
MILSSYPVHPLLQSPAGLCLAVIVLAAFCYLVRFFRAGAAARSARPAAHDAKAGSKTALSSEPYVYPLPAAYPDWSIEKTKPLPYRAFRYGPKYHVTMGLRTVTADEWIELDSDYPKYHAKRTARLAERADKCVHTDPSAWDAAIELLDEMARYLPERYPTLFRRTAVGLDNLWSGESFDFVRRPLLEDPMAIAARLVQDDLAIMVEGEDGRYYLRAGAILLAGFWRLSDKLGMPLEEIHTSGDVPQYNEKLQRGMSNFFTRLRCGQTYCRNNYFIQVDDDLAWSGSIGAEDDEVVSWSTAEKDRAVEHHWFRSERQSLRRLPKSKAVIFTIRTYFHPVTELVQEDYVPGRLASAVRSWGDDVAKYKGREKYGRVLCEYLDREHEKQLKRGLDLSKESEVRAYPY